MPSPSAPPQVSSDASCRGESNADGSAASCATQLSQKDSLVAAKMKLQAIRLTRNANQYTTVAPKTMSGVPVWCTMKISAPSIARRLRNSFHRRTTRSSRKARMAVTSSECVAGGAPVASTKP